MSKRVKFNEEEMEEQKQCHPGPNVKFTPKALPFGEYLSNSDIEGSLGCGPGKYPRYKDGKYCCETEKASDQDNFDYVNYLIQRIVDNVPLEAFNKYTQEIEYLIYYHNEFLNKGGLINTLELPEGFENIDEWYSVTKSNAAPYKYPNRPYPADMPPETKRDIPFHVSSNLRREAIRANTERRDREQQLKRSLNEEISKHFIPGGKKRTHKKKSKKNKRVKRNKSSKRK